MLKLFELKYQYVKPNNLPFIIVCHFFGPQILSYIRELTQNVLRNNIGMLVANRDP